MAELTREALEEAIRKKVERPIFGVLCGDHLRGWATTRSTYVIAGGMLIPVRELLGLRPARETKERAVTVEEREVLLSFHDMRKWLDDLARATNTRVLEELYSPYVVFAGPELEQLRKVARSFMTRHCFHDYLDRASALRKIVTETERPKVTDLLESARVYLTGVHCLRTAELVSNLASLSDRYETFWLRGFIARQQHEGETATLSSEEARLLRYDLEALEMKLHSAHDASALPDGGGSITTLDEFLIDLRMRDLQMAPPHQPG